jgi:hypothetical protein
MPPLPPPPVPRPLIVELQKIFHSCDTMTFSSAEALVFLGFNITMRYISLHFTWRILEHERSRMHGGTSLPSHALPFPMMPAIMLGLT